MSKPTAYRGTDPYAFVAYSHNDEKRIHEELNWINARGFNTYYDDGIHPGHRWREEIAAAIDDALVVIFFISPRSIASDDCLRELNYALDQDKPVLAIHLEMTELPSGIKLSLNDRQAILAFAMSPGDYRLRVSEALGEYLTPAETSDAPDEQAAETDEKRRRWQFIYLPVPVLLGTLALLIALGVWWDPFDSGSGGAPSELSRAEALELLRDAEDLVNEDRYGEAFYLIQRIEGSLGAHPALIRLQEDALANVRPRIRETGASVFFRPQRQGVELDWIEVGVTPLSDFSAPRGVLELRIEKAGYKTGHYLVANPGPLLGNHEPINGDGPFPEIEMTSESVQGTVRIPATQLSVVLQGAPQQAWGGPVIDLPAYEIDQNEVTNRAFKTFVDAGGYEDPSWWQDLTFPDGRHFDISEHRSALTDTTGDNAPANWSSATIHPEPGTIRWAASAGSRPWHMRVSKVRRSRRCTTGPAQPRVHRNPPTQPCTWSRVSAISTAAEQIPLPRTPSAHGEPMTWPATCVNGHITRPVRGASAWVAPTTITSPITFTSIPCARSTGNRTTGFV